MKGTEAGQSEGDEDVIPTAGFEDGRRGHVPRNAAACRSWKRQENGFFPESSQRNAAPLWVLAQ